MLTDNQKVRYGRGMGSLRYWVGELTKEQFIVLWFIIQRTLGFGKTSERISIRHFLQGVPGADIRGIPVSRTQLRRVLFDLEDLGLIHITGTYSRANNRTDTNEIAIDFKALMNKLKTPRKLREPLSPQDRGRGRNPTHPLSPEDKADRSNHIKENETEENQITSSPRQRVERVGQAVRERNRTRRTARAQAQGKDSRKPADIQATWRNAQAYHFERTSERIISMSLEDAGILSRNWKVAGELPCTLADLFEWCTLHWTSVHRNYGRGRVPKVPSPTFVARNLRRLVGVYLDWRKSHDGMEPTVGDVSHRAEKEQTALKGVISEKDSEIARLQDQVADSERRARSAEKTLHKGVREALRPKRRKGTLPPHDDAGADYLAPPLPEE